MTVIPYPLSLLIKAVDMASSTLEMLNPAGTYTLSPPLFTPCSHTATNAWTLSLHDFTYEIYNSHALWGVFSFGAFKGIMMIDRVEIPPAAPPSPKTEESDDELEEGEIRESALASAAKSEDGQTSAHHLWNQAWKRGQRIHLRWRGSRGPVTASSYSDEDFSPRKRRCFGLSATRTAFSRRGMQTQSSIPRSSSWAGDGEIVFLDNDSFELVFRNQEEVWQLDGLRTKGRDDIDQPGGLAPWAIVDGYGKSWYELFWLAERRGDWRGDVDAELMKKAL